MSTREKIVSDIKVGIVTFTALMCLVAGILFAGGDKGLLMQDVVILHAELNDVNGLKKGASVTMGGMDIGKVTQVSFSQNSENLIDVSMIVRADVLKKIKKDSKPCVRTQGMLGDRYIEITKGSQEAGAFDPSQPLIGNANTSFDDTLQEARTTLLQTSKMLEAINKQQGTAGQFIYDQQLYQKLLSVADQINTVLQDFKQNPKKYIKLQIF